MAFNLTERVSGVILASAGVRAGKKTPSMRHHRDKNFRASVQQDERVPPRLMPCPPARRAVLLDL
jgi:hypothetical protein